MVVGGVNIKVRGWWWWGVGCVNIEIVGGGGGGGVGCQHRTCRGWWWGGGCQHFRLDGGGGTPPAYVSISMKMTISVDKNYIKLKEICSN